MKLSKTLLITGILFSSILGSVNVNSITATAADNEENQEVRAGYYCNYDIQYRLDGRELTNEQVKSLNLVPQVSAFKNTVKLSGQRILKLLPQNIVLLNNENGHHTYEVKNNKVLVDIQLTGTMIDLPPVQHITDNKRFVKVIFYDGLNDIESMTLSKDRDITSINPDEIQLPKGYSLRPHSNLEIQKDFKKNIDFVRVLVQRDLGDNTETDEPITDHTEAYTLKVIYLDKDGKQINDDKLFKKIKVKDFTKLIDENNLEIPNNFKFVSYDKDKEIVTLKEVELAPTNPETPTPKPNKPSHHGVSRKINITFVNKMTNEEVGNMQLDSSKGLANKIVAPNNFKLADPKDAAFKFDKKNKSVKIYVVQETPKPVMHEGVVTTMEGQYKFLYTFEGKKINNRALSEKSSWYTDQFATINGVKMYRVATNEWVKASDIK